MRQWPCRDVPAAIRSTRIVTREGVRPGIVLFEDGKIISLGGIDSNVGDIAVVDAGNNVVLPGLLDAHAHLNEPGRTHWEGFFTGTRAAAAGGFTSIIDMPLNCIPSTTDVESLALKREAAAGQSSIDYGFWGGVVATNTSDIPKLANAGVRGFKCFLVHPSTAEFQMVTEDDLHRAMPLIAETGLPLLVHAELPGPIEIAQKRLEGADWRRYATYRQSRPDESEVEAVRLMIRLCRQYECRVHIVHLSTAKALPEIRAARAEGLPITVETCPHYLFFSAEQITDGATQFKCAPPIRDAANREALWDALRKGVIDLVGTDHSPCPPELKCFDTGDFRKAWGGISGLSLALSAVWTEASKRAFTFNDVARWMAERPARLAGFEKRKGRIEKGYDANFVIFDPDAEFEVSAAHLYFRHACSPYIGQRLRGAVRATFVRGDLCFDRGHFTERRPGTEIFVQ
jgi:allantoinase